MAADVGTPMTHLYHRTRDSDQIMAEGFRGRSAYYLSDHWHEDVVWFSGHPDDGDQEVPDVTVIEVVVPTGVDLATYDRSEEGNPRREWAVPATVANQWVRRIVQAGS